MTMIIGYESDGATSSITITEQVARHNALHISRKAGSDRVLVSILGQRGGTRAVVELTPGLVSRLVQGLISEEMHLTDAMLEKLRADARTSDG